MKITNKRKTTFPKPLDSLKYKLGEDTDKYTVEIKKRGRPVGSKNKKGGEPYSQERAIKIMNEIMEDWVMPVVKKEKPFFNLSKRETEDYIKELEEEIEKLPDSEATAKQVKDWSRFKPQGNYISEDFEYTPEISKWKLVCFMILMVLVAGMILATPTIIKLAEVCSQ
jgi:hypothetical protein